jgi:hypothetical protein
MDQLDRFFEAQAIKAHANDTTRKDPFEKVSGANGAPMGRTNWGTAPTTGIRLLKARFVDGAYDQSGAYWGMGQPIYAAVDSAIPCTYCHYVRANSREEAAKELGLVSSQLSRKL